MAVEAKDVRKLVRSEGKATSRFFGTEVPKPGDWLGEAIAKNEREKLFHVDRLKPFYLPRIQLAEGMTFPGLRWPLDPWLYDQIRAGKVDADADWLPEGWILLDLTRRPNYDGGKQMYPDTPRFKEMLATLREQEKILVPNGYIDVPKDSRFDISPDKIDGSSAVVAKAVTEILGLKTEQVTTLPYVVFNYIGNRAHPELGQANTSEWFRNNFERGPRLLGGHSDLGGLAFVFRWLSDDRDVSIGFRLLISSPVKA